MARPHKNEMDKTTHKIQIRTTSVEKSQFEKLASEAGLTITDLIKKRVLSMKPKHHKPTPDRTILLKTLAELSRQGSNVNQIARYCNIHTKTGNTPAVTNEVIEQALRGVITMTQYLRGLLENGFKEKG
jgi:Bacterial mobilisation protein (MobC)